MTGSRRGTIGFGGLLVLAMSAGAFLTSALSVLAPFIIEDLGLSRTQMGMLFTVMFSIATVASPFTGHGVDRFGGRRGLIALFVAEGLAVIGVVMAPSWLWLLVALAVGGLSMAAMNPITNHLISQHVPHERQGLLMGIKQSGGQVNWFFAGLFLPPIAVVWGWRPALVTGTLIAVIGIAATARLMPPSSVEPRMPVEEHTSSLALVRTVRWLAVYAFVMTLGMAAVGSYLPLYAFERLGYSEAGAGLLTAAIGIIGVVSRIVWGRWADHLGRPSRVLAWMSVAAAVGQLGIWLAEDLGTWLVWPSVVVFGATAAAWATVAMLAVVRMVPSELIGRASGMMLLGGHASLVVTPIAFGATVDWRGGDYTLAWGGVTAAFLVSGLLASRQHTRERRATTPTSPRPPGLAS